MPEPLTDWVKRLGLDSPDPPPIQPEALSAMSQQYPRFAQALGVASSDNNIQLNITGPNIIGGPEPPQLSLEQAQAQLPGAPPTPSLLDRAGAFLAQGDLPQRLRALYTQHGPEAFLQGLGDLNRSLQASLPQGRVPLSAVAPALNTTLGGAMTTLAPLAYGPLLAHPVGALLGGIAGTALSGGTEAVANRLGADPETAALLGNLAGYLPPEQLAAAALPFAPYARKTLMGMLETEAAGKVKDLLQAHPDIGGALKWLHPSETVALSRMTPASRADFARVYQALPSDDLLGALARAGIEKQGWYEHSRAAINHVYGPDADLFAGVLAATSPQNSVEMNLKNATRIFRGWVDAGRPTDRDAILKIMGENVLGEKGDQSVLNAWKNNTVSVLQGGQAISGPKVDSFWRNLRSRPVETPQGIMRPEDAVTLDAWMSNVLGVRQTNFASGSGKNLDLRNPGYSPGYLAATAKLRQAATAAGMTPEQIQETIWSWGKALYEQSEATKESAVDIVKRGALNHSAIAGTPDFSTLFQHPDYHDTIRATGAGPAAQLETLQPATFPPLGATTPRDQAWQLKAAATLDRLRESRDIASDLRIGKTAPGLVNVNVLQEGMPGATTRVAPELATEAFTQNQRDAFARQVLASNTDVRGENVLLKALGMPTTETTVGIGQWTPPGGATEYNTLDSAGVQARLRRGELHPVDAARIVTAARLQGLLDAQQAVASTGVVYDQAHKDTLHVFTPNKVKAEVFAGLTKLLPADYALVNKGGGTPGHVIDIVRLNGAPIRETDAELVRGYLAGSQKKIAVTPGTNVAGMYFELPWSSEGAGTVTASALEHYDTLPAAARAGLDSPAVKQMAAAKLRVWATAGADRGLTVPADYRQMLQLVAEGGVSALRRAMANPEQLIPALLLLGLARPGAGSPIHADTSS